MFKQLISCFRWFVLAIFLTSCGTIQLPGVITVVPDKSLTADPNSRQVVVTPPSVIMQTPVAQAPSTPVVLPAQTEINQSFSPPQYVIIANMDYDARTLDIQQDIDYSNTSSVDILDFLLAVEPNRITGVFNLGKLVQDDSTISDYSLNGQRLQWKLSSPLKPGQSTHIHIEYQLLLPSVTQGDPNVIRPQIFGVTTRQINLTDWYPMIVPYDPRTGWRLAEPWFYGEHLVYPLANFDVTLRFKDRSTAPVVAASAMAQPVQDGSRYVLEKGRDFVFAMGRQQQVSSADVDGVTVSSYFYPGSETGGQAVLDATSKALKTYSALFGPYPHKTLSAVQGDFNDGMEFDGLYYLSNSFYNLYDGTQKNYLPMVAAHETSHQWWFGEVASDQAKHPWMDESLATYSEKLFYEKNYPDLIKWWWSYRIDFYQPDGKIDGDVPSYGGFTPYTNATYRQGAHFLEDLRQAIGEETFFAFLKKYVLEMDGKIAEPSDFFRILREVLNTSQNTSDLSGLFNKYFAKTPN